MLEILNSLPLWYQYSIIACFGLIIGSFLNVVIYRYHTGKSLSGHSHCMSCGHQLSWYELFPLFSYLLLRGRCRACGATISLRYFIVELGTALLFLLAFSVFSFSTLFLFSLVLISVLMVVAVYDIYHMIIPNELVVIIGVLAVLHFIINNGTHFYWELLMLHVTASVISFFFYGGLWFVSKGRWIGFGDAKLSIPLGFMVGLPATFSIIVFSFWIGAIVSIVIMYTPKMLHLIKRCCSSTSVAKSKKYFTMNSEIPFAPFMIASFLIVYLYHIDVLEIVALLF